MRLIAALAALLLVLIAFLGWRLAEGPIGLGFLVPYTEQALADEDSPYRVVVGDLEVVWTGRRPEVLVRDARLLDADDMIVAVVPAVSATLSLRALGRGRIALSSIEAQDVDLVVVRSADGAIALQRAGDDAADPPSPPADPVGLGEIMDWLDRIEAMRWLRRVTLVDAAVAVDDAVLGERWHLPGIDVRVERARGGRLLATLSTRALIDGARKALRIDAAYDRAAGRVAGEIAFDRIVPARLAGLSPELAPLERFRLALSGSVRIEAGEDLVPDRAVFAFTSPGGSIALGDTPDRILHVGALTAEGSVTGMLDRVDLVSADVALDGTTVALDGDVTRVDGGFAGRLAFRGLRPDSVARALPAAAAVAGAVVALDGEVLLDLDETGGLAHAVLAVDDGAGRLDLPDLYPEPLAITGMAGTVAWDAVSDVVTIDGLEVDLDGVLASAAGRVVPAAEEGRRVTLRVEIPSVDTPRVMELWPRPLAKGGRRWVTENLSGGRATGLHLDLDLLFDPAFALVETEIGGGFAASGITLRYWEPMLPITGVEGRAEFVGGRFTVDITGGVSAGVNVVGGRLLFTDLGEDVEWLDVTADLEGPLTNFLTALDRPPLHYAAYLGLDPGGVTGTTAGRLQVRLPLLDAVDFDEIDISADADIRGAVIPDAVFGDALSGADLRIHVDKAHLDMAGAARLRERPVTLMAQIAFEDAEIVERYQIRGPVEARALADWDLDFFPLGGGRLDGVVEVDLVSELGRDETRTLTLRYDLTAARFTVPELQWAKPAGETAVGEAEVRLAGETLLAVPRFTLSGGGLIVEGGVRFDAAGALAGVDLARLQIGGRYDVAAVVEAPETDRIVLTLDGALIDARPFLGREVPGWEAERGAEPADGFAEADGTRWIIRMPEPIAAVLVGGGEPVRDVRGELIFESIDRFGADLEGRLNGADVVLTVVPYEQAQTISVKAGSAGTLLRALGLSERVDGGTAELTATRYFDRPDGMVEGRFVMRDFRVGDVPILVQVLSTASITGPLALLTAGQRLEFNELDMPFIKRGDVVELPPGRAYGAALGITFQGGFDIGSSTMDVVGTLVPSYAINRVLGAIPILGRLLTGGEGEGVFAATYRAIGPIEDPQVRVNPLTALAPGFLRGLFGPLLGAETGTRFDPETDPALGGQ